MGLMNKEEIIQLLKIVSESTLDEVHLEIGDLKFTAKRHTPAGPGVSKESIPEPPAKESMVERRPAPPVAPRPDVPPAAPLPSPVHPEEGVPEGLTPIRAPMLGTFYRAPKPDAPPFVKEGQFVSEEDVVCIVEVMKLFNTIKAGVKGRIVKICAENAQLVEYKQVLFLIEEGAEEEKRERSA